MIITRQPLSFYTDKILNKEQFSLARYGDGEWLCLFGKRGTNSNGCEYTDALRKGLEKSLHHEEPNFYYGMQRILPYQARQVDAYVKKDWVDSEIFTDELARGKLKPFIDALRTVPTVIIGNETLKAAPIPYQDFIEVRNPNAYEDRERVYNTILWGKPAVYLFSCGMAAGVFVSQLHGKVPGATFIDIGHVWDIFVGVKSREYLRHLPDDIVKANL